MVPGLSASSSSTTPSPAFPSSSSQDSVFDVNRYTENPVQERSGSTSGEPLHETTETENTTKNGESEEVQRDMSHELPDWLQEFRETLVDESVPTESRGNPSHEHRDTSSSSHELQMEPRAKMETGLGYAQHLFSLPERPKMRHLLGDENNKGFLQKTCWYSCAQSGKFW